MFNTEIFLCIQNLAQNCHCDISSAAHGSEKGEGGGAILITELSVLLLDRVAIFQGFNAEMCSY